MAKYLKEFKTVSEYNAYMADEPLLPNVSLVDEWGGVRFNSDVPQRINALKFTTINYPCIIGLSVHDVEGEATGPNVEYSYDGKTWNTWDYSSISLQANEYVYIRGYNPNGFSHYNEDYSEGYLASFVLEGDGLVECEGNVMTLIDYSNPPMAIPSVECFEYLFDNCNLTTAPELPATALTEYCYSSMFRNCSLTTAPVLPATTLAEGCYESMFTDCTGLTSAPTLPATTLVDECYAYMFSNSSSLNFIECLATDISASNCTYSWVNGIGETGTFVKDPNMNDWTTGTNGIPNGWTVQEI